MVCENLLQLIVIPVMMKGRHLISKLLNLPAWTFTKFMVYDFFCLLQKGKNGFAMVNILVRAEKILVSEDGDGDYHKTRRCSLRHGCGL